MHGRQDSSGGRGKLSKAIGSVPGKLRADPRVRRALDRGAETYSQFLRKRYDKFSRGGGNWQPLAKATLEARARMGIRHKRILYAFGLMFSFFRLGASLTRAIRGMGITVSLDRRTKYGKRASYHDEGGGFLPQRKLIVPPDSATRSKIEKDGQRDLKPVLRDAVRGR